MLQQNNGNNSVNYQAEVINVYGSSPKNLYISKETTISDFKNQLLQMTEETLYDSSFKDVIEKLNHFMQPAEYNSPRNLETKLINANREYDINEAKELKTKFSMKLTKNNFSETAQKYYASILALLKGKYDAKVKPLIKCNAPLPDVENAVDEVITYMFEKLSDTVFEQDYQEIRGMLYFLTGNCHIEWS